jgi:hypothetical protein
VWAGTFRTRADAPQVGPPLSADADASQVGRVRLRSGRLSQVGPPLSAGASQVGPPLSASADHDADDDMPLFPARCWPKLGVGEKKTDAKLRRVGLLAVSDLRLNLDMGS